MEHLSADLRQRICRCLDTAPDLARAALHCGASGRGDFDLNPHLRAIAPVERELRPAAVLVPLVERDELTVLLTLRAAHLSSHAGQISFPGGRIEPDDPSPIDAALREAEEEVGLSRDFVEIAGFLDSYETGSGFRILPVVGFVRPGFTLVIDPAEVAEVFEVPLAFFLNPGNHERHSREWQGMVRQYYAMPYEDRYVWGTTAGMLRNLYERLNGGA